jgi:hypothetical protein
MFIADARFVFQHYNARSLLRLPNLVMIIRVDCTRIKTQARTYDTCDLYLHQSMPAGVAFFILQTPVFLRKCDHSGRTVFLPPSEHNAEHVVGRISSTLSPQNGPVALSMYPAASIAAISLYSGASLHSHRSHDLQHLDSQLSVGYTPVTIIAEQEASDEQAINTTIGLLRLQGPRNRRRSPAQLSGDTDVFRPTRGPEGGNEPNPVYHMFVKLSRLGAEVFLDAVS